MAISKKTARAVEGKFTRIARTFSRNRGISVRLAGTMCYTDMAKLINLPANSDFLSDDTQHLLEGMLDHEVGHCVREQRAKERRALGDKTFPLYSEICASYKLAKQRNLLNVFEDIALEAEASRTYVGMAQNLADKNAVLMAELVKHSSKLSPWKALTCGIIARARGHREDFLPPALLPILDKLEPVIARARIHTETAADSERRMLETMEIISDFAAEPEAGDEGDAGGSGGSADDGEESKKSTSGAPEAGDKEESKHEEEDTSRGTADKHADKDEGKGETDEPDEDGATEDSEEHGAGSGDEDDGAEGDAASSGSGDEESAPESGDEEGTDEGSGGASGKGEEPEGDDAEPTDGGSSEDGEGEESEEAGDADGDGGSDGASGEEETDKSAEPAPPGRGEGDMPSTEGELDDTRAFARALEDTDSDTEHGLEEELEEKIRGESAADMREHERHYPHPDVLKYDKVVVASRGSEDEYKKELAIVNPVVSGLRARLMQYLRSMKVVRLQGDKEHGSIDIAALYSLRLGNKRIFAERTKAPEVNTVIGVLVDQSGSMSDGKIATARQSAIAVGECLSKLGISFGIWGFDNDNRAAPGLSSGHGWEGEGRSTVSSDGGTYNRVNPQYIRVFKGVDEPFMKVRTRLTNMGAGSQNVDGEAVQWCVDQLRARPEPRKILLVLSDGAPCCPGTDSGLSGQHIRHVVAVAAGAGVEVFGLGVLTDCVRNYYSDWGRVGSIEELPKVIFDILRKYLFKAPARGRKHA